MKYVNLPQLEQVIKEAIDFTKFDNKKQFISSFGVEYGVSSIYNVDYIAKDSTKAEISEIQKNTLKNPCFEYVSLTNMFPIEREITLYKHTLTTTANYVNNYIPVYLNLDGIVIVEAENIYSICEVPLGLVSCFNAYLGWSQCSSQSDSMQNKTYVIKNNLPIHITNCLNKYSGDC